VAEPHAIPDGWSKDRTKFSPFRDEDRNRIQGVLIRWGTGDIWDCEVVWYEPGRRLLGLVRDDGFRFSCPVDEVRDLLIAYGPREKTMLRRAGYRK
jgi:hypothetical protein